jgi:hypothetical protein
MFTSLSYCEYPTVNGTQLRCHIEAFTSLQASRNDLVILSSYTAFTSSSLPYSQCFHSLSFPPPKSHRFIFKLSLRQKVGITASSSVTMFRTLQTTEPVYSRLKFRLYFVQFELHRKHLNSTELKSSTKAVTFAHK